MQMQLQTQKKEVSGLGVLLRPPNIYTRYTAVVIGALSVLGRVACLPRKTLRPSRTRHKSGLRYTKDEGHSFNVLRGRRLVTVIVNINSDISHECPWVSMHVHKDP